MENRMTAKQLNLMVLEGKIKTILANLKAAKSEFQSITFEPLEVLTSNMSDADLPYNVHKFIYDADKALSQVIHATTSLVLIAAEAREKE